MKIEIDINETYPDTEITIRARRLTQDVEDLRAAGETRADLDWDAALAFLSQVQNLPGVNTNAWVSGAEEDRGGFIYRPAAAGGPGAGEDGADAAESVGEAPKQRDAGAGPRHGL